MKNIIAITTSITLTVLLSGCGMTGQSQSSAPEQANQQSSQQRADNTAQSGSHSNSKSTYNIVANVPYADASMIQSNVVDECTALGTTLADSTKLYGDKYGINVALNQNIDKDDSGRNVILSITDATSSGSAGFAHHKTMKIRAELFEDGKLIDTYSGFRSSKGGFFGGFKGSCSVLGRCAKTLGSDISKWLKEANMKH